MTAPRFLPRQRRKLKISLGARYPAFTADVSAGGFSVDTASPARVGTAVEGSITVDGREFPFGGEVTWSQRGDPRMSIRGRMGVRFTEIDFAFFELLLRGDPLAG